MSNAQNRRGLRRVKQATVRTEKAPYDFRNPVRTPRLGAQAGWALCQLGGSLNAASGSWPSITPTNASGVSIYRPNTTRTGLTEIQTNATVQNYRNVTWSASKTTYLLPSGNGAWCVIDQDC